jgi:hypothetical protein
MNEIAIILIAVTGLVLGFGRHRNYFGASLAILVV